MNLVFSRMKVCVIYFNIVRQLSRWFSIATDSFEYSLVDKLHIRTAANGITFIVLLGNPVYKFVSLFLHTRVIRKSALFEIMSGLLQCMYVYNLNYNDTMSVVCRSNRQ